MATIEKRTSVASKLLPDGTVKTIKVTRFRARVRLSGYPEYSKTFDLKSDARDWARSTEHKLKNNEHMPTPEARRRTIAEMIDKYIADVLPVKQHNKDQESVKQRLKWWKKAIGSFAIVNVTPAVVVDCRDKLLKQKLPKRSKNKIEPERYRTPATVNRYLSALGSAFKVAQKEWYWTEKNPTQFVSKLGESRGRERFLNDEERKALLQACEGSKNAHLVKIVILALSTGARRSELLKLTWSQVDLKNNRVTLFDTKNGNKRVLNLYGRAHELIEQHQKVRYLDTDLLFPCVTNHKIPSDITKAFNNAVAKAGIANFRFHDLRHSAASYLAMNGATLNEIAEVLGHKTLQMVKRYSHFSEQHTAGVVKRMNEGVFGK